MLSTTILQPRPYAKFSGRLLLLPLLPPPKTISLPSELWARVFGNFVGTRDGNATLWALLTVSKRFSEIVLPLIYTYVQIHDVASLGSFYKRLHETDIKWDSIRRIPYSAPGRYVQNLQIAIPYISQNQALQLDSLLTDLFPILPFLAHFCMKPLFILGKRALASLTERAGVVNIRSLTGLSYVPSQYTHLGREPIVELLRNCPNLEELEVTGQGLDPDALMDFDNPDDSTQPSRPTPLNLPHLRILTLLSHLYNSHLMHSLLDSDLPSLAKLTITPYDDIPFPSSFNSRFISTHGNNLRSLLFFSPKSWPTRLRPTPTDILQTSPNLRHLSLEIPVPYLTLDKEHPLEIISVPRPNPESWALVARLLPKLPSLKVVRARDVRWLRKGMGTRAQEAGVQGEMREWRRRLARRGIRYLDVDWKDTE
ncbi:hypothetical protein Moror_4791 [Moniliophthora roreri MCA 2997]|uniref:F-box domain-containing protein n=1 Tax=Moniliophthora roreri (strain MCA 2997) TaxID=1381753 RepID=V2XI30_MONRO|nr:hypothetical protein Moror_4791 [Moniliophthora roreri MCA 2997]